MRKTEFDTKLIIYKSRRIILMFAVLIMTGVFLALIHKNNLLGYPWYTLAVPIGALGLLFLLIPMTEEWEYKPWQGKARRIEQQER